MVFLLFRLTVYWLEIVDDYARCGSATADSSCGEFAWLKSARGRTRCGELITHLLQTCAESFDFLFLRAKALLLLGQCGLQLLDLAMLLEELIEQHRVHRFVTDAVGLALVITRY